MLTSKNRLLLRSDLSSLLVSDDVSLAVETVILHFEKVGNVILEAEHLFAHVGSDQVIVTEVAFLLIVQVLDIFAQLLLQFDRFRGLAICGNGI